MTDDQNELEDQFSAEILFEPLRSILSNIIHQNKQLREEINQLKQDNQTQSKKNEDLQFKINQIEEQNQLRHKNLLERLKKITDLYEGCNNQLNEQMNKDEEHQHSINRLQTNDEKSQNTQNLGNQSTSSSTRHKYQSVKTHSQVFYLVSISRKK